MAQSGVDPTDKSYGVFINSNQSSFLSTQKSQVSIPFQANLADHDPNKAVQIAMTSMLFTNTIYNITEENNKMNVLIYYKAGRGLPASQDNIQVVVPPGFYNITQLSNYLSKSGVMGRELVQTLFRYGVIETYVNVFTGFGAVPLDPNDPILTKAAPTNDSNTKIVFQSPDLAHMVQFGTDLTSPTNPLLPHSYIYQGIYVECPLQDTRYAPLLKMLGFFNINSAPPKDIPLSLQFGPAKQGYGMEFRSFDAKVGGPAYDNTVFYQVKDLTLLDANVILKIPTSFHGIVYTNSSVILTCAYELAAGKVIELPNGYFVTGGSLSIPSPYVVAYQDAKGATADFINGSDQMFIDPLFATGVFTVGMAIGIQYGTNGVPIGPSFNEFDYATGFLAPGLENTHCYYIIAVGVGGLYTLNQPWLPITQTITFVIGTLYVLTTVQLSTPGGIVENMLASPTSVSDISGILTPSAVTNVSGVDEIHIHCAQLRTQNLSSTNFLPLSPSDVIAVVPVEVEFGFKQNYQPPNPLTSYLSNTNVDRLDIDLTDAKGQPLNFNGVDWSMTLFISEVDAMSDAALNSTGSFNTPFQDQLSTLEGTAGAQHKRHSREIIFYDKNKRQNVGSHRPTYAK